MNRRAFLKNSLAAGAVYGAGGIPGLSSIASASSFAPLSNRTLVNVMLDGGPDFRHLFAPAYSTDSSSFGYQYWQAMSPAHNIAGNSNAWEVRWNNDYTPINAGGTEFGILKSCDWLTRMWHQGHVAIISNVYGSSSRDHAFASMIMDQGNRTSGPSDANRSGWGGRLATATNSNVVALTRTPRPFCYGPDVNDPEGHINDRLVAAQDVRDMKLFEPEAGTPARDAQPVMTRALRGYYAAKRNDVERSSKFRRFLDLENQLRSFGEPIDDRIQSLPIPDNIAALYDENAPLLDSPYFGLQIRNLYDSLALNDIFNMRVASLEYQGFDTHDAQQVELETRLTDLFGSGKGLDALWQNLPIDARANTVFVLAGEFGRQIRANGDFGTDHGEGTYIILIGEGIAGGVYGDMYPESELALLGDHSPQIAGQTAIDHVFGQLSDWMQPGAGDVVFPDRASAPLEAGLNLGALFA